MLDYCCLCGKRLVPFRKRMDWEGRESHKKCYRKLEHNRKLHEFLPEQIRDQYNDLIVFRRFDAKTGARKNT